MDRGWRDLEAHERKCREKLSGVESARDQTYLPRLHSCLQPSVSHQYTQSYLHYASNDYLTSTMVPVLSPGFSSSSSSLVAPQVPSVSRQLSTSSVQSFTDLLVSASTSRLSDSNVEVVRVEGLRHAKMKLDAR